MASSEVVQLLRQRRFARYFAVVAAARGTGTMFNVAGILLVLQRTGSLTLAGVVVAAATLPGALTGPLLGAWLDVTASRRRLLVLDRTVTALALTALLLLAGHSPHWLLPVVAVLYGITSPLSSGAFSSVLPEVAGPKLLDVANTFEASSINAAFIVGPALAGLIAATVGVAAAVEVQIGAGVLLAVAIATDTTFELRAEHAEPRPEKIRRAVTEGLVSIWRIAPLRWNTIVGCIYTMAWGTLNVGFPAYASSLGSGAHAAGYMWAAISFGSMLSAFALRRAVAGVSLRLLTGLSFLAMAGSVLAWPLAGALGAALALIFLTGALEGPSLVALIAARQQLAPVHLRAQIFSTISSLSFAAFAAGSGLAGPFQATFGTDATLLGFAALMAVAGLLSLTGRGEQLLSAP